MARGEPDEGRPEGCICHMRWYGDDDNPEQYIWSYNRECPVALRRHPWWRSVFAPVFNFRQTFGGRPGGALVVVSDKPADEIVWNELPNGGEST
jgi:hypothetical protein